METKAKDFTINLDELRIMQLDITEHKHLVLGNQGQIGMAIEAVLEDTYPTKGIDKGDDLDEKFDVLHVCYPGELNGFRQITRNYQEKYLKDDGMIIIHATESVGTSAKLDACHSPVRGIHPDLVDGILTFTKFFGGRGAERGANYFKELDIDVEVVDSARTTELGKILSTTQYGIQIIVEKEIKRLCDKYDVDFHTTYKRFNQIYNEGYEELGHSEFRKPVLKHITGEIGGHCVVENTDFFDSWIADLVQEKNDELIDV